MNSWLSYLKYKIYEDVNTVLQLLLIDNKIQGTKYDINYLVNFINENLTTISFFFINDSSFLIEGNPLSLIKVINDNLNDNGERVVVLENNVAINKWIISVYEDYIKEYDVKEKLNIEISNHFNFDNSKKLLIIGSRAFINETKDSIKISYDTLVDE